MASQFDEVNEFCYISAPPDVNLEILKGILSTNNIKCITPSQMWSSASTIIDGIIQAISHASLFIAVIDVGPGNEQVYFELGIAIAKQRRILIVAQPSVILPSDLSEIPSIHTSTTNNEAITHALDQVLSTPTLRLKPFTPKSITPPGKPIGDLADRLLTLFDAEEPQDSQMYENEVVNLLALALRQSGVIYVNEEAIAPNMSGAVHESADLAVWSDEFDPWIGNPLLIEVKASLTRQEVYVATVNQVSKYLQISGIRSALVLYATKSLDITLQAHPYIFFMNVRDLLASMRTKSFARIIIDLRNRLVHGIDAI